MPSILHPGRWLVKPPLGSRVDTGSPFGQGMVGCFPLQKEHQGSVRNLISGVVYGPSSTAPTWEEGRYGLALDVDGAGKGIKGTAEPALRLQRVSLLWRGYIRSTPADFANFAGVAPNATDGSPYTSYVFYKNNAGQLTFGFNNGAFQNNGFRNISDFVGNGIHQFVLTIDMQPTTAGQRAYTDDGSYDGGGGTTGTISYSSDAIFLIGDNVGGRDSNAVCQCVYIWDRILSKQEVSALWREPFQMFNPPRKVVKYVFFPVAAGTLTGSAGIVSGESVGSGGVVAGAITGASGIASGETMTGVGAVVSDTLTGSAGIVSEESVPTTGASVTGPITGTSGIASGEAFGSEGESVTGPITGAAGIASGEAMGSGGSATGPITGSAGIPTAAAMGSGGDVRQAIIGSAGITSAEAFGEGDVLSVISGYFGIESEEGFGRSGTVQGDYDFGLFIRGRDRIFNLKYDTMNVQKEQASRSSATFTLRKRQSDGSFFRPLVNDEVVYTYLGRRIFAGFITSLEEYALDSRDDEIEIKVSCNSYRKLAENRVYSRSYEGNSFSMASIVGDLYDATLRQEGISFDPDEDLTITGKRFKIQPERSVDQALDYIASVFGADWKIDDYRRLRMNRKVLEVAPHVLTQNGQRFDGKAIHRKLRVFRSDAEYRNRQGLQTGVAVSGLQQTTLQGHGGYTYTIGWPATGKPTVKVNGTAKTVVSSEEIADGPYDFYYTLNEAKIRQNPTQAAYTSSDTIVITAPSASLDVFYLSNEAEIARRAARTGGTGLVEVVTPALGIRDQDSAESMAQGMMERFGGEAERITWESDVPFWDIGQLVSVRMTAPLVAGMFLIQSVSISEVGGTFLRYSITAVAFALPKIIGLTAEEGETPGSWDVEIIVDRPHGLEGITDGITLWGIDGWEPIWGTWTVDPIDETTLTFHIDEGAGIDLSGLEYSGGLGGSEGGGTIGYGGTEDPFGGVLFSGMPPGAGVDPRDGIAGGIGQEAFVITNVNINTNEVTTSEDHGFSSSYPTDNGFRVAIFGVKGCDNPTTLSSINTISTRVEVTATNKFIARDVGSLVGADGFVNDGGGRVIETDDIVRSALASSEVTPLKMFFAAATPGENLAGETAVFVLANAVPGVASRPLAVASNVTNPWIAERDISVAESVSGTISVPPDGAPVLIDVKKNGVSIFAAGTYLTIPPGETATVRETNFATTPLVIEKDDKVTVDVVQVGSDFAGCNATVHLNMRG